MDLRNCVLRFLCNLEGSRQEAEKNNLSLVPDPEKDLILLKVGKFIIRYWISRSYYFLNCCVHQFGGFKHLRQRLPSQPLQHYNKAGFFRIKNITGFICEKIVWLPLLVLFSLEKTKIACSPDTYLNGCRFRGVGCTIQKSSSNILA
uniref:Uncharacterized protein n=1 Tax=Daphnia galeata TaxID=27404 RepID=A0A8J2RP73_9CRUS|nr:unnamed protein product [Daphnia galeata]